MYVVLFQGTVTKIFYKTVQMKTDEYCATARKNDSSPLLKDRILSCFLAKKIKRGEGRGGVVVAGAGGGGGGVTPITVGTILSL